MFRIKFQPLAPEVDAEWRQIGTCRSIVSCVTFAAGPYLPGDREMLSMISSFCSNSMMVTVYVMARLTNPGDGKEKSIVAYEKCSRCSRWRADDGCLRPHLEAKHMA